MRTLSVSMQKFGFLSLIIVDRTTNMIADDEHRALVYKEFGKTEIFAYMVEFKDEDAVEISKISSSGLLQELSTLIATQADRLQIIVEQYEDSLDRLSESPKTAPETKLRLQRCVGN
jgi:hypothetical protein